MAYGVYRVMEQRKLLSYRLYRGVIVGLCRDKRFRVYGGYRVYRVLRV